MYIAKIYEETIEGSRCAAEYNIYLRHCQNRLEGCPAIYKSKE